MRMGFFSETYALKAFMTYCTPFSADSVQLNTYILVNIASYETSVKLPLTYLYKVRISLTISLPFVQYSSSKVVNGADIIQ